MSKLKIAIQKSGRLSEKSIALLEECGLKFPNGGGKLITESSNFPVEILFLRDDDIPQYVEQNVAHIGIIGENVFIESQKQIVSGRPSTSCLSLIEFLALSQRKEYDKARRGTAFG